MNDPPMPLIAPTKGMTLALPMAMKCRAQTPPTKPATR